MRVEEGVQVRAQERGRRGASHSRAAARPALHRVQGPGIRVPLHVQVRVSGLGAKGSGFPCMQVRASGLRVQGSPACRLGLQKQECT